MSVTDADRERAAMLADMIADMGPAMTYRTIAAALAAEREKTLVDCAAWVETLASPTLAGDPFILAADWAAKLVRQYATKES